MSYGILRWADGTEEAREGLPRPVGPKDIGAEMNIVASYAPTAVPPPEAEPEPFNALTTHRFRLVAFTAQAVPVWEEQP